MDIFLARAQRQIKEDFPDLGVCDLRLAARGPVFTVLRGTTKHGVAVGIRIATESWIETGDHHPAGAHTILAQECRIITHCRAHDLPAPEIIGQSNRSDHEDGLDLFVHEWLEDDGNPPASFHMGDVLRRLHAINPPAFVPCAMHGGSLEKSLTRRIMDAAGTITRLTNRPLILPKTEALQAHLSWPDRRTSLLHMNFLPATLHATGGLIRGLTGWCDALIGPPTLELVWLDEMDILDDSFLGGYANYEMFRAPKPVETAFRLDAATRHARMLLLDAQNTPETQRAVNRVAFLFDAFAQQSAA